MRFQTLFKYRKNMMAAAIMMILLYHTKGAWPEIALKKAAAFFYGGVDVFFFCSGIGCFFSYCGDRDPAAFLRRRAARILPVYLPFILVWLALHALDGSLTVPSAAANLFGVHGFTGVKPAFNWYVSGMWLSYLLTPWLAPLAERCDTRLKSAGALLGLLTLSAAFWGDSELVIIMTRLPVFFAGMLFAAESRRREALSKTELALLICAVPVGGALLWETLRFAADVVWAYGLAWYPLLLIAPGLCILIAAVCDWLSRFKAGQAVNRALAFLGGLTFEIYLVHFWAVEKPLLWVLPLTAVYAAALHGASLPVKRGMKGVDAK